MRLETVWFVPVGHLHSKIENWQNERKARGKGMNELSLERSSEVLTPAAPVELRGGSEQVTGRTGQLVSCAPTSK